MVYRVQITQDERWQMNRNQCSYIGVWCFGKHLRMGFSFQVHVWYMSFLFTRIYVFFVKETWIFYKLLANYYLRIDLVGRRWKSWSPGEWYLVRDFECQARWCEDPSRLTSNIDLVEYPLFERSCAIIGTQQTTSKRFSFKSIYDTLQMSR